MKKLLKILLVPSIMVLTNCADVPSDLLEDTQGNKYSYCVLDREEICLSGPFASNSCNGYLSNECPYERPSESCSNEKYNPSVQGCCSSRLYNLKDQICDIYKIKTRCGYGWYDSTNTDYERCRNDVLETYCGGKWYYIGNASSMRCMENVMEIKCENDWYSIDNADLKCKSDVLTRCGEEWYLAGGNNRCQNNAVETRCGYEWYNAADPTFICLNDGTLEKKCGSALFNAGNINLRCESNIIETKCGNEWYDEKDDNYRCNGSTKQAKCGDDNWYRTADQRCGIGNVIETVCGEEWKVVVDNTWQCESDIWKSKCGDSWYYYDPTDANERCIDNVVSKKCGAGWYNVANQRCENNVVETQCGNDWYNAADANLRCDYYVLETKCGTNWYDTANENLKCENNIVKAKCGNDWYNNFAMEYCSSGTLKTYKTVPIGDQTWMAEDLKCVTSGSACSGIGEESDCDVYGRLYDFATTMNLPLNCNQNVSSCSGDIDIQHKGICPDGWHIPTKGEWDILLNSVGGSNVAGIHLKAKEGWNSCGPSDSGNTYLCEDDYGFAALPRYYNNDDRTAGEWWTASTDANAIYHISMLSHADLTNYYSAFGGGYGSGYKVRCVKDSE